MMASYNDLGWSMNNWIIEDSSIKWSDNNKSKRKSNSKKKVQQKSGYKFEEGDIVLNIKTGVIGTVAERGGWNDGGKSENSYRVNFFESIVSQWVNESDLISVDDLPTIPINDRHTITIDSNTGKSYTKHYLHRYSIGDRVILNLTNKTKYNLSIISDITKAGYKSGHICTITYLLSQKLPDNIPMYIVRLGDGWNENLNVPEDILLPVLDDINLDIHKATSETLDSCINVINNISDRVNDTQTQIDVIKHEMDNITSVPVQGDITIIKEDMNFSKCRLDDLDDRLITIEKKTKKSSKLAKLAFLSRFL